MKGTIRTTTANGVQPTSISVEATIIRKDGTVEQLGTVAFYHKNPLKRWWWHLCYFFRVVKG